MINLKLNKEIYPYESLQHSYKDYAELAKIKIEDDSQYWILSFSDCLYDEAETAKEYENYLIELTYGSLNK